MSAFYARRLIEKYNVKEPKDIDLGRIAADLEISIEENELDGCDGMLQMMPDPKCGIITVRKTIKEVGQKRFVIGHELGHYETSSHFSDGYHCGPADLSLGNYKTKPEECAANEFSAELLMPEKLFLPRLVRIPPSMDLIKDIASDFTTTLTATLWRFIELTDERCAMVCSENGKVKYTKASKDFGFYIQRGMPLHSDSLAIDFFEKGFVEEKMQSVLASAWINNKNFQSRALIKEHTIAQPSYNSVLTLLWMDEDIDGRNSLDEFEDHEERFGSFYT